MSNYSFRRLNSLWYMSIYIVFRRYSKFIEADTESNIIQYIIISEIPTMVRLPNLTGAYMTTMAVALDRNLFLAYYYSSSYTIFRLRKHIIIPTIYCVKCLCSIALHSCKGV